MLSPKEFKQLEKESYNIDELCDQVNQKLKDNAKYYGLTGDINVILAGEYPASVRLEICERYKKAGWHEVTHITTSENGERPGLTSFHFVP